MLQNAETTYRYRWVILGVLWTSIVVAYLHRLGIGPLAPFLKEDLSLSSAQIGTIVSAVAFGFMVSQLPSGWVVDKIGARWPIGIGEMFAGISMIGLFFAPSYQWLLILMFCAGLGSGSLMPATTQSVVLWFARKERATVMGLKQTAVSIGAVVSAATLPTVALAVGWRYGFLLLGGIAIIVGIVALILYKEPPRLSVPGSGGTTESGSLPMMELLKNRDIWLLALSGFCLSWTQFTVIAHLVLYLTESLAFPVITAGGLLAMTTAAGAIARPGSGLLSDRVFGGRRKPVFIMMAATASLMCLILGLWGSYLSWAIYPVLLLFGLGGIGFGGIFFTVIAEFGGRHGAGRAMGLAGTISISGSAIGPVIFGYLVDISGSYQLAWLSLTFIAALCIPLIISVREGERRI